MISKKKKQKQTNKQPEKKKNNDGDGGDDKKPNKEKENNKKPKDTKKELPKSVEDILKDTVLGNETKGKTKQYIKEGDYEDAVKDFESLVPSNVENIPGKEGKMGILRDGRKVNVRAQSSDKRPTLEIISPENNGKRIKIRYQNKK